MQLLNLIGQYHQNGAQPTETVKGVKGVESLTQTLRGMKAGNVFEGTVSSVRGQKVTLALSNGQEITARLDGKLSIRNGQSMFFQVKSNDGQTIQIRPFQVDGVSANLTLINALKAAGLTSDAKNLSMVNTMMQEQMSIDANSVNQMARAAIMNPDIDVTTLVQMQKLGITLSPENASQFENYQNDAQAITKELLDLVDSLPEVMGNESLAFSSLRDMNEQVLKLMLTDLPEEAFYENSMEVDTFLENAESVLNLESQESQENLESQGNLIPDGQMEETVAAGAVFETLVGDEETPKEHTLAALFTKEEQEALTELWKDIPGVKDNPAIWKNDMLNPKATSADLLNQIKESLNSDFSAQGEETLLMEEKAEPEAELVKASPETQMRAIRSFFASREFSVLAKDIMGQQWLLKPEEVARDGSVKHLYEKLESQIRQLEDIVKTTGQTRTSFAENAADIRNNISFMNEINQTYTYVQLPLKMNGQNANGDLYVYTNKKALLEGEKDLTAFLHLDMDHLGSTDISIRMKNHEVSTNFYMEDDASFQLIQENSHILEERLAKKGYHVKITVANESNQVNFVENFLKKDAPSAGQLRRYSFDMRA